MKQEYISPEMEVILVNMSYSLLAGSVDSVQFDLGDETFDTGGGTIPTDDNSIDDILDTW